MDAHPHDADHGVFFITSNGGPVSDSGRTWNDVPEHERLRWVRYMLDFPPYPFKGFIARMVAGAASNGRYDLAPADWVRLAADLTAAGFTPVDFYALSQELERRMETGQLTQAQHGEFFLRWGWDTHYVSFILDADAWAEWPRLVAEGRSPRRATEYVLTHGNPKPIASWIPEHGTPVHVGD